jgi:hypothetical protein
VKLVADRSRSVLIGATLVTPRKLRSEPGSKIVAFALPAGLK